MSSSVQPDISDEDNSTLPEAPRDAPFFVVLNASSGRNDAEATRATIERVLGEGGRSVEVVLVDEPGTLPAIAKRAVESAKKVQGVVVAAGGDGTLNAVAGQVLGSGVLFAVLPQGTFNLFGRNLGISGDTEIAARALLDARLRDVQVGTINGHLFLVNASLGLYPQLLEDREAYKQRLGRSRPVAFLSGVMTLLRDYRPLRLLIDDDNGPRALRTPSLFVGNNRLQIEQIGVEGKQIGDGHLVAIAPKPIGSFGLLGLAMRGALKRLGDAEHVETFSFRKITVRMARSHVKVAVDGELLRLRPPIEFRVSAEHLRMLVPANPMPRE